MTRPPAIRMNPARLPEPTAAQKLKIREHYRFWKGKGKVSVVRKGQVTGHVCISVTEPGKVRRMWYDRNANLVRMVIERPLFTLTAEVAEPQSALLQQTEE